MEIYKQIRKMRLEGMSQRQIAATLHISRNTVKKYWDGNSVHGSEKSIPDSLAYSPRRWWLSSRSVWRKTAGANQRNSITQPNGSMIGWWPNGALPVARQLSEGLVKELREKQQEAFVPLAFPPGDALQIDWGEATVYFGWV